MFSSIQLFGYEIYLYPLIIGMMWSYAYLSMQKLIHAKKVELPYFKTFFIALFLSCWIGAKLFFLFSIDSELITKAKLNANFWLGGGFVFYGGLTFGVLTTLVYKYLLKIEWDNFKMFIPLLALGHGVGRIGCFLAGCCYGSACDLPWAINLHGVDRHPVQLYEAIVLISLYFIFLKRVYSNKSVILEYLLSYSLLRFSLEFLRGDEIRGFLWSLSTSQVISVIIFAISTALIIRRRIAH